MIPNMATALPSATQVLEHAKQLLAGSFIGRAYWQRHLIGRTNHALEKSPPPARCHVPPGGGPDDIEALAAESDHNVWVIKSESNVEADIHKDVRTELSSEDADTTGERQQLIILDGVDADDQPT